MKALVKHFHSPDVDPPTGIVDDDAVLIDFFAGPADSPGAESFSVLVCTPRWVTSELVQGQVVDGRHRLFVERIDLDAVQRHIREYVAQLDEPTWIELTDKIGRLGKWEFEDYRE
ncbi:hypothetical protein HLB23_24430 [Nocardia uniformis]|uniref:Immunity protein 8 of polymorphic toxin system n=1 Tax=Nocardia uniformis TaxID=53432 RepID=A0A849C5B2_9NOCA|nr:Imm8 family immunity protein [Nocardia uniformis]NNH72968.1 hypothetical protein [Nocardia uniformis]